MFVQNSVTLISTLMMMMMMMMRECWDTGENAGILVPMTAGIVTNANVCGAGCNSGSGDCSES